MNEYNYYRLKAEYDAIYEKSPRPANGVTYKNAFKSAAIFTVITLIFYAMVASGMPERSAEKAVRKDKYEKEKIIFCLIALPVIPVFFVIVGITDGRRWKLSEKKLSMAVKCYDCLVTDCGGYVSDFKLKTTYMIFKYVYIKDGVPVTALFRLWFAGIYKGDINRTIIGLFETNSGEKILRVIPRGGGIEFRIVYL